ncbi:MAG: hypothetical protein J5918_08130 [Prevotella sp.]|nr:hypothetical protein [Prevotella sp.]
MMIAMVGGMFFSAPQIASADNGDNGNGQNIELEVIRYKDLKVTQVIYKENGDAKWMEIRYDDGTVIVITPPENKGK